MLFHSLPFFLFFTLFFLSYWSIFRNHLKWQNLWILIASYVFYSFWDWKFGLLMFVSTAVDYSVGWGIGNTTNIRYRKLLLAMSLTFNLGLLFIFKYFDFFIHQVIKVLRSLGLEYNEPFLEIILPVGISFYTFQTLSYSLDIYKNNIKPTQSFIEFGAFVSFFPQLVAGPIERATNLLPQFQKPRVFNGQLAVEGLRQFLWGLFKKTVMADQCAQIANTTFELWTDASGITLLIGAIAFSFQIYGDFSGYSDMAIGIAKLLGFNLNMNFNYPYFSKSIGEFWRRWHISLSSWFKDYVYIPLGGNRYGRWKTQRNIAIVFILSGLWHGANWTFLLWGAFHGLLFLLLPKETTPQKKSIHPQKLTFKNIYQMSLTFLWVTFAWIIFRAEDYRHAFRYFNQLLVKDFFHPLTQFHWPNMLFILPVVWFEWKSVNDTYGLAWVGRIKTSLIRWCIYMVLSILILIYAGKPQPFIYFQF
jgi:D-alanyl-lipoteichoic acid acyltransferase DltB (MBOAT superfamily)